MAARHSFPTRRSSDLDHGWQRRHKAKELKAFSIQELHGLNGLHGLHEADGRREGRKTSPATGPQRGLRGKKGQNRRAGQVARYSCLQAMMVKPTARLAT